MREKPVPCVFPDRNPSGSDLHQRSVQETLAELESHSHTSIAPLAIPPVLRRYLLQKFTACAQGHSAQLLVDGMNRVVAFVVLDRDHDGIDSIDKRDLALQASSTNAAKVLYIQNRPSRGPQVRFARCRVTEAAKVFFDAIGLKAFDYCIVGDFAVSADSDGT